MRQFPLNQGVIIDLSVDRYLAGAHVRRRMVVADWCLVSASSCCRLQKDSYLRWPY
jgi:hypothetical protein